MPSVRLCAGLAAAVLALVAAPSASAGRGHPTPSGEELWQAYPLNPSPTATTASATPTVSPAPTAAPARRPAPADDGPPLLPIGLAILAAGAAAAGALAIRRRRAPTPPPAKPAPVAVAPHPENRNAERLRAAVDIRLGREWPWPAGSEQLWRCEIAPESAALSARFRAIVHPPGGGEPSVIAASATAGAAPDWQSAAPLERAVAELAATLEADGWEPVAAGGDAQVRRFCWHGDGAPPTHT